MATLPENVINISQGVTFTEQPSYTWYVNPVTGRISGMADGFTAVKQARCAGTARKARSLPQGKRLGRIRRPAVRRWEGRRGCPG